MKTRRIAAALMIMLMMLSVAVIPVAAEQSKAEQVLTSMTTEEKIAQMIMPAFRWKTDDEGNKTNVTEITDDIVATLKKHPYAGVILFAQNTATNAGTTRLVDALQKANAAGGDRPQLIISTDQEGGNVTRLTQGTMMPGNMALGAINDVSVTKEVATMMGKELTAIGINADFAPDVDVNSNPANPVIGVRSFSDDAQLVAAHGSAFVQALNKSGVISTLKHFPGHGDTDTDSHTGLPLIDKSAAQLEACELLPFREAAEEGVDMLMTAHIQFPQIESDTYTSKADGSKISLPATLSDDVIGGIVRKRMGYDGVIITDAMNMDAIQANFDPLDAARLAINAGVDMLLMPVDTVTDEQIKGIWDYISGIEQMVRKGDIPEARLGLGLLYPEAAALHGPVDVELVALEVHVLPLKGGGLPRAQAGVEDGQHPQPRRVGLRHCQDVGTLLRGDGPVAPLDAGRELKALRRVVDDEPGPPGLAEHLLEDHPQLGHMGEGLPRLAVEDVLEVEIPDLCQGQPPHRRGDVAPVLFLIGHEALPGQARRLLVELHPPAEPLVHRGDGLHLPLFQVLQELGQTKPRLLLAAAPHLIASPRPGEGLADVAAAAGLHRGLRVLFHCFNLPK